MKITSKQLESFYVFLSTLVSDDVDIMGIKFVGADIIVIAEPIKGEIENRAWSITREGELNDTPSFFHE